MIFPLGSANITDYKKSTHETQKVGTNIEVQVTTEIKEMEMGRKTTTNGYVDSP